MTDAILCVAGLDAASIEHRLLTMRRAVRQLDDLGPVDLARLEENPATGLAVERVLALLADLAFAINATVCATSTGEAPRTPERSFQAAARAGLIDDELAATLTPAEGLHHVLVQLFLDSEPEKVAGVVAAAVAGYGEYVLRVGVRLASSTPSRHRAATTRPGQSSHEARTGSDDRRRPEGPAGR